MQGNNLTEDIIIRQLKRKRIEENSLRITRNFLSENIQVRK
jgi:hypothetical protein